MSPQAQSSHDLSYIHTHTHIDIAVCVCFVSMCYVDTCFLCVFSQGFTGKPGTEGPQGPVGMYVSDSSAGQIQGMHLHLRYLFTAYT